MRVGLLGGAFDPPHLGHLICAQYTLEALELDKIVFIPSGDHPFKRGDVVASAADRLAMTKLSVAGQKTFEVSSIEVERQGITYTIDTIEYVRSEHPDWELYLLVGADNIADFEKWHRYQDILGSVQVVIFRRSTKEAIASPHPFLYPDTPIIDISSTEIRKRVKEGKDIRYLVTANVAEYIESKQLYGRS
jgi:nicotinate-nucleotide adenylyltransferase